LIDDNGDGVGRESGSPGVDGPLARATYLQPLETADLRTTLPALSKRQSELEAEIQELKGRRATMTPEQYEAQLERLLIELARVSARIRSRS
jgi:hypothetical protein